MTVYHFEWKRHKCYQMEEVMAVLNGMRDNPREIDPMVVQAEN